MTRTRRVAVLVAAGSCDHGEADDARLSRSRRRAPSRRGRPRRGARCGHRLRGCYRYWDHARCAYAAGRRCVSVRRYWLWLSSRIHRASASGARPAQAAVLTANHGKGRSLRIIALESMVEATPNEVPRWSPVGNPDLRNLIRQNVPHTIGAPTEGQAQRHRRKRPGMVNTPSLRLRDALAHDWRTDLTERLGPTIKIL